MSVSFPAFLLKDLRGDPVTNGALIQSQTVRLPADLHEIQVTVLMTQDQSRQSHLDVTIVGELSSDNRETWYEAIGTADQPQHMLLGNVITPEVPEGQFQLAPHAPGQSIGSFDGIYGAFTIHFDDIERWTTFGTGIHRRGVRATHFRARVGLRMKGPGDPQYAKLGIAVWGTDSMGEPISSITQELVTA